MGKAGEKQKRRPKIKDKRQSERFKEAARELSADKPASDFDKVIGEMARPQVFVLKGSRGGQMAGQVGPETFTSLRTALERAAVLFDQYGSRIFWKSFRRTALKLELLAK
jgi:hypothetical protein